MFRCQDVEEMLAEKLCRNAGTLLVLKEKTLQAFVFQLAGQSIRLTSHGSPIMEAPSRFEELPEAALPSHFSSLLDTSRAKDIRAAGGCWSNFCCVLGQNDGK